MIDFHSHILPEIDDGSQSLEESMALLEWEAEQGIDTVVLTPHFYARYDQPEEFFLRRQRAMERLRQEMVDRPELPQLRLGAEVHFFRGMSNSQVLPELAIAGTDCILVEMPEPPWSEEMYRELERIHTHWGLTPILAHIDRYIRPFHTYGIPDRMEKLPVIVQANASFFLDNRTRKMALRMLRKGQIQILGSDCHNLRHRPPKLGPAVELIEKQLGPQVVAQMQDFGQELLGNE